MWFHLFTRNKALLGGGGVEVERFCCSDFCFFSGMYLRVQSAVFPAKGKVGAIWVLFSLNGQEESCTELCSFLTFCRF